MAKRQVFFSFHYSRDSWRASQVRNMGKVSDSSTFKIRHYVDEIEKLLTLDDHIYLLG